MKKLNKVLAMFLAGIMLVGCLSACGEKQGESTKSAEADKVGTKIVMSTGSSGSLYYSGGIAVTQLWTEKLGASASASSSSGSVENMKLLVENETNMGIIQTNIIMDAYNGKGNYDGNPQTDIRILAPLTAATYHILVRKDSGIKCLTDCKGKRVCVYPAGSGNATTLEAMFKAVGMTFDDVKGSNIALNESIDALKNGSLDMTIVFGQYPNATVMDALAGSNDLEVVPFTDDEIKKITEANPWISPDTVPAGTYTGQTEEIKTLTHCGFICVKADFPENDAYLLVKTLYGNLSDLYATFAALDCSATHNPVETAEPLGVPFHEGAERALKELGLKK